MQSLRSALLTIGVIVFSSACSSGLPESTQILSVGTSGSDALFASYDLDHDQLVTDKELQKAEQLLSLEAAKDLLSVYDRNGNGLLDKVEFSGFFIARHSNNSVVTFKNFDKDQDGFISIKEFSQVYKSLHSAMNPADLQSKVDDFFAVADTDYDDRVDAAEFSAVSSSL